jgi:hypothetical protein
VGVGKNGDRVWAKAAHRDPTRSSRSKAAVRFGHKWLAWCVLVRRWAITPCYDKLSITFADALATVRRELWEQVLLRRRCQKRCLELLPPPARRVILWHLAIAA